MEAKDIKKLNAAGYNLGKGLSEADGVAANTKRKLVLSLAKDYHDKEQVAAILDGFAKYHADKGHGKGTVAKAKSEIKAVFEAVARTEVTGDNLTKLSSFVGEFNAWIQFARDLRDTGSTPKERNHTPKPLTAKQQDAVEESLDKASDIQIIELADYASKKLHAIAKGDKAAMNYLRLIEIHAHALSVNESVDPFFHNLANDILSIVQAGIDRLSIAEVQQETGTN